MKEEIYRAFSREKEFKIKAGAILKKYESFFDEVYGVMFEFNGYVESLSKTPSQEFFDFAEFISTDEDIQKFTRLTTVLHYVDNPNDPKIINLLKNDIAVNALKSKNNPPTPGRK